MTSKYGSSGNGILSGNRLNNFREPTETAQILRDFDRTIIRNLESKRKSLTDETNYINRIRNQGGLFAESIVASRQRADKLREQIDKLNQLRVMANNAITQTDLYYGVGSGEERTAILKDLEKRMGEMDELYQSDPDLMPLI